ncbi:hypothetical protein PHLH8_56580 [Pseudomonas sp. Pc102]|uniref:hypothetical protein n=1 Tax=Pseudomonas sp. Pc102 TaxID=2678261 RepID=UPI001BF1686A|nr:hypothetical protein [Pseudomonas sp. Pc102]BBP86016.1 hypothetical protein PHLH8_56580 [Pseudomonas sp. Pc102]
MKFLHLLPLCFVASAHAYDFTNADLCKAAVAIDMGRDTSIMKTKNAGEIPVISYTRDDGDSFTYRCKIVGNQIIWSGFIEGQWGRWRDSVEYGDTTFTYRVSNGTLIVHSDMAEAESTYQARDFQ